MHHLTTDALARLGELSGREHEVLALIAMGADDKAIASRMSVSHGTVRTHISSLFRKLGARNRTEAALAGQLFHLLTCAACAQRLARLSPLAATWTAR
jgi:DNA-binding NarL/FixJ family response regulator